MLDMGVMRLTLAVAGALGLVLAGPVAPAFAHDQRQVGPFRVTVGWAAEPAYTDAANGVEVEIRDASGQPVTDAEGSLRVQVGTGAQRSNPLPLLPQEDAPGTYRADILPTRPGAYTFHLTGSVRGQALDATFTSSDSTFEDVRDGTAIEFPAQDPTRGEMAQNLTRTTERTDRQLTALRSDLEQARREALWERIVTGLALLVSLAALTIVAVPRLRARPRARGSEPAVLTDPGSSAA